MEFDAFLEQRLSAGGFTTEDALNSFLPLAREALDAHETGHVAPLEGTSLLHVDRERIYFLEGFQFPLKSSGGNDPFSKT